MECCIRQNWTSKGIKRERERAIKKNLVAKIYNDDDNNNTNNGGDVRLCGKFFPLIILSSWPKVLFLCCVYGMTIKGFADSRKKWRFLWLKRQGELSHYILCQLSNASINVDKKGNNKRTHAYYYCKKTLV